MVSVSVFKAISRNNATHQATQLRVLETVLGHVIMEKYYLGEIKEKLVQMRFGLVINVVFPFFNAFITEESS